MNIFIIVVIVSKIYYVSSRLKLHLEENGIG